MKVFLLIAILVGYFWINNCQEVLYPTCTKSQYLNPSDFKCKTCQTNAEQSSDGFSCKCKSNHKFKKITGSANVECEPCPANSQLSPDGWTCLTCTGTTCTDCTGALVKSNSLGTKTDVTCGTCGGRTALDATTKTCKTCTSILLSDTTGTGCTCTAPLVAGSQVCYDAKPTTKNEVSAANGTINVVSGYLQENMVKEIVLCKKKLMRGCQSLANMCVLQLYNKGTSDNACSNHVTLDTNAAISNGWRVDYPWLYYAESTLMSRLQIRSQYQRNNILDIKLAKFDLSGNFIGLINTSDTGQLQLCKTNEQTQNQVFKFGIWFKQSCSIQKSDFFDSQKYPPVFFDPYVSFNKADGKQYFYPVPIKNTAVRSTTGNTPNRLFNEDNWILTRRLMLVDNVGAIKAPFNINGTPQFVNVAQSIRIVVYRDSGSAFDPATAGRILAPLIEVNYTTIALSEITRSSSTTASSADSIQVSFEVVYRNPSTVTENIHYNLSVAMGVLCALAGLYAILRTYFWSRRTGCVSFEFISILKCLAYACGSISDMFFIGMFGFSLYYLILYKNQQIFSVIPPDDDSFYLIYIIVAFFLKLLEMIHMFVVQCSVDIFFIDWERPSISTAPKNVIPKTRFDTSNIGHGDSGTTIGAESNLDTFRHHGNMPPANEGAPLEDNADTQVSIWRTYLIANEWNELQTYRKTSLIFNLMVVLLFMNVVGYDDSTRFEPYTSLRLSQEYYQAPYYRLFRFATTILIFSLTGLIQFLFTILIYERVVEDKLRNYVDLCSVANISVFVLECRQFGYYLHGRSVHGSSDISLAQMFMALRKEAEGKCAKRGLEADSDQQTYIMALPALFSQQFQIHFRPELPALSRGKSALQNAQEKTLLYKDVNLFLDRLINKTNSPLIKFVFQDRKFFEDIFNGEFEDHSEEGKFYRDNGTAFGNVLYYGNELTLIVFDMLVFTMFDLMLQNTMFDVVGTWVVAKIFQIIRNTLGKRNLANKTMVDERFLI